ncbi:MAG TPA: beta-ketoacyl synthase N-terminal-like domain-containing protein, partial [Pyrinomonadaceae bacterium]|nr:beta-ketoacyl synthase N-terminal-like domain-containing protein [Pyrinomonadaceae bacterium]
MRRVVVTGIGTVSALGNSTAEFWSRIAAGKSGIGPITRCDVSELRFKNAAEVKDFDPKEHFDDKTLTWIDLFCQYGMVAAREAVADSGIEFTPDLRENTGVITGSCLGGKVAEDEGFRLLYQGHRSHQP